MAFSSTNEYMDEVNALGLIDDVPDEVITFFNSYVMKIYRSDEESKYSKPMLWIGMYIALASLICILAMVGDLLHGLRTRKLWFPCKYFSINAASLTVIAVAMKLPVDLSAPMPGNVDQVAKLGSMAFMCSMMANLLPSLATMCNDELFTNIVALVVLVITLVVNICIQIATGVVSNEEKVRIYRIIKPDLDPTLFGTDENFNKITATIHVTFLLMLLIIHLCSSLAILKSKQIIESKYQNNHARALQAQQSGHFTLEVLKQHVRKYWIMGGTGSPQFITVCSPTTSASGVICVLSTILHIFTVLKTSPKLKSKNCESDYQWSMLMILVTQFIGVVVGTIAPLSRCFAGLSFKMSIKRSWNHINVFEIESYWIQKLSDWKQSSIPIPFRSGRKCKVVIEKLKFIILSFLIEVQEAVVVTCKMISLIPFFFMMCVLYCLRCLKCRYLKRENVMCHTSSAGLEKITQQQQQQQQQQQHHHHHHHQQQQHHHHHHHHQQQQQQQQQNPIPLEQGEKNTHQLEKYEDLSHYVLQLHEEQELHEKTLKSLLKYVNHLFQKAEKQEPNKLMTLLEKSRGFKGVEKFDNDQVPTFLSKEYLDCWSLPVVTLTTIVVSLPNIQKDKADNFLKSVSEALTYVTLVEESLNVTSDYESIQKAAKTLWREVEFQKKWLAHELNDPASKKNIKQILEEFRKTAKNIVTDVGSGGPNDDSICRSICANSMYRITKTIMDSYKDNIDQVSEEDLFAELSSMISDIVAACLTNLSQVIALKCHSSEIEKREANVHDAAQLLGETTQIIKLLQDRELPSFNQDDLPFIHKWRAYLRHP